MLSCCPKCLQALVLIFVISSCGICQGLPRPTGRYPVGRAALAWTDRSRAEIITDTPDDYRELLVYIWYPAAGVSGATGPYWPGVERTVGTSTAGQLSNMFGPIWEDILSGKLQSHSYDNARIGASGRLPILIFSPGGGSTSIAYTTQMEEIASRGYVVVGVEHTFDAPAVLFPNGHTVGSAAAYWTHLHTALPDNEAFEKNVTKMFAADILFVIGRIVELSNDRTSPFYSRLDAAHIGVFGHSRGGRDAALACQLDSRIKACLSEDGSFSWQPFWLDANGRSMIQPFMMLDHLDPELPDDVYSQIGTTREAYVQKRTARQREADKNLYGTIRGGSYRVTVTTPGISHNSFSDIRLLGRPDSAQMNIWPKNVQAATPHEQILRSITEFTLAFFDKYLRGISSSLLTDAKQAADTRIQRFGAAR